MKKRSQKKIEAPMEKEVPLEIKKNKEIETVSNPEKADEEKTPLGEGKEEKTPLEEGKEEEVLTEQEERQVEVKDDVGRIKNAVSQLLLSSFDIKLDDDDLVLLSQKILAVVSSFVADTTVDRVKDISGDLLKTTEEQIKEKKEE